MFGVCCAGGFMPLVEACAGVLLPGPPPPPPPAPQTSATAPATPRASTGDQDDGHGDDDHGDHPRGHHLEALAAARGAPLGGLLFQAGLPARLLLFLTTGHGPSEGSCPLYPGGVSSDHAERLPRDHE